MVANSVTSIKCLEIQQSLCSELEGVAQRLHSLRLFRLLPALTYKSPYSREEESNKCYRNNYQDAFGFGFFFWWRSIVQHLNQRGILGLVQFCHFKLSCQNVEHHLLIFQIPQRLHVLQAGIRRFVQ